MDISSLIELPDDLLDSLSGGTILRSHPKRWAFLDTETTGLAGGAGTYAFLIGVGSIDEEGFRVRQFFMRDFGDEPSLLAGLTEHLSRFDVLITYNGKTYDVPLLETRYRMARARPPFARLAHLDLLHGARPLVEAAPRQLPAGRSGESHPRSGARRRSARRDDSVLLLRIPAHAAGLPARPDFSPQRDGYRVAGLPDGGGPLRVPVAGRPGAAPRRGPGGPGALAGAGRAL